MSMLFFIALIILQQAKIVASSSPFILRIRWPNGSMGKLMIKEDKAEGSSLQSILASHPQYSSLVSKNDKIQDGKDNSIMDDTKSLRELGLKHGSLLSIISSTKKKPASRTKTSSASSSSSSSTAFHPFPELTKKDATRARYDLARQKRNRGSHSYSDLVERQSNFHVVEPQGTGPIHRVYMCATSAQRFHASTSRRGLLFGTIQRERKQNLGQRKIQTSLSSQPKAEDFCQVAKVHTIWEPPSNKGSSDQFLLKSSDPTLQRVQKVASYLGLKPIGWIFSYENESSSSSSSKTKNSDDDGENSVIMTGKDLVLGSKLQIQQMQQRGREEGAKFVTLAMQASDGATEAFQLSDVCVQMTAEGILQPSSSDVLSTVHEIVVDGKETTQLDSVLCLVNTALLSHEGMYVASNNGKASVKNKTGTVTLKTKKALLKALESSKNDDSSLLSLLCDFPTLLAVDTLLGNDDQTQDLCRILAKYSRGQKQGSQLSTKLKRTLKTILSS